jgi:hypothetical protein
MGVLRTLQRLGRLELWNELDPRLAGHLVPVGIGLGWVGACIRPRISSRILVGI